MREINKALNHRFEPEWLRNQKYPELRPVVTRSVDKQIHTTRGLVIPPPQRVMDNSLGEEHGSFQRRETFPLVQLTEQREAANYSMVGNDHMKRIQNLK